MLLRKMSNDKHGFIGTASDHIFNKYFNPAVDPKEREKHGFHSKFKNFIITDFDIEQAEREYFSYLYSVEQQRK